MRNKQENRIVSILALAAFLLMSFNLEAFAFNPQKPVNEPEIKNYVVSQLSAEGAQVSNTGKVVIDLQPNLPAAEYQGIADQYAQNAFRLNPNLSADINLNLQPLVDLPQVAVQEKDTTAKIAVKNTKQVIAHKFLQDRSTGHAQTVIPNQRVEISGQSRQEYSLVITQELLKQYTQNLRYVTINLFEVLRC